MEVRVISISPPTKSAALASAKIAIHHENESLIIDDLRVLKNANDELWVGFPSRIVNGAYTQLVFASHRMKRQIEDAVIAAYEEWAEQAGGAR